MYDNNATVAEYVKENFYFYFFYAIQVTENWK